MKRLFYLCALIPLFDTSAALGVRAYAALQPGPVHAPLPVRLCTSVVVGANPALRQVELISHGIDNAIALATQQWQARFRAAHLTLLKPVTYRGASVEPQNALACVRRHDTFGFIGPIFSGAAMISQPVLNNAGMVQISASNTDPALTNPFMRLQQEPATYDHRLAYLTYYRVVTTNPLQGPSDAAFLKRKLHANTFFLVDDTDSYGAGIAVGLQSYAAKIGLRLVGLAHIDLRSAPSIASTSDTITDLIVARHPDAVFYGGTCPPCNVFVKDLRRKSYAGPLVGPDSFHDPNYIKFLGNDAVHSYASDFGLDPAGALKSFRKAYLHRFQTPLQPYDALAYDAANINLHAIYMAATHGTFRGSLFQMRAAILSYIAHVRWHGATGVTTFDRNGDTRHRVISMYQVRAGKWVFIGAAPKVTGVSPTG